MNANISFRRIGKILKCQLSCLSHISPSKQILLSHVTGLSESKVPQMNGGYVTLSANKMSEYIGMYDRESGKGHFSPREISRQLNELSKNEDVQILKKEKVKERGQFRNGYKVTKNVTNVKKGHEERFFNVVVPISENGEEKAFHKPSFVMLTSMMLDRANRHLKFDECSYLTTNQLMDLISSIGVTKKTARADLNCMISNEWLVVTDRAGEVKPLMPLAKSKHDYQLLVINPRIAREYLRGFKNGQEISAENQIMPWSKYHTYIQGSRGKVDFSVMEVRNADGGDWAERGAMCKTDTPEAEDASLCFLALIGAQRRLLQGSQARMQEKPTAPRKTQRGSLRSAEINCVQAETPSKNPVISSPGAGNFQPPRKNPSILIDPLESQSNPGGAFSAASGKQGQVDERGAARGNRQPQVIISDPGSFSGNAASSLSALRDHRNLISNRQNRDKNNLRECGDRGMEKCIPGKCPSQGITINNRTLNLPLKVGAGLEKWEKSPQSH